MSLMKEMFLTAAVCAALAGTASPGQARDHGNGTRTTRTDYQFSPFGSRDAAHQFAEVLAYVHQTLALPRATIVDESEGLGVDVSPDGTQIAVAVSGDYFGRFVPAQVLVIDTLSGQAKVVSQRNGFGNGDSWDPRFSPDSRRLGFRTSATNIATGGAFLPTRGNPIDALDTIKTYAVAADLVTGGIEAASVFNGAVLEARSFQFTRHGAAILTQVDATYTSGNRQRPYHAIIEKDLETGATRVVSNDLPTQTVMDADIFAAREGLSGTELFFVGASAESRFSSNGTRFYRKLLSNSAQIPLALTRIPRRETSDFTALAVTADPDVLVFSDRWNGVQRVKLSTGEVLDLATITSGTLHDIPDFGYGTFRMSPDGYWAVLPANSQFLLVNIETLEQRVVRSLP